jgi:hypothetical protein
MIAWLGVDTHDQLWGGGLILFVAFCYWIATKK